MKILMVISEVAPVRSGVSRVGAKLREGLETAGHTVDFLSMQDVPRAQFGEVRLSSMLFKLPQIHDRLATYDLIHLHGPVPTFSDVFLLASQARAKGALPYLVYTHHAPVDLRHFPFRRASWLYNHVHEAMARRADHVIVSTPSYRQLLSRWVAPQKLSVIPWGVDFEAYETTVQKPGPFTVVFLGQIRPYKGLPVLLDACAVLEDTRLWIIGKGHQEAACRQHAARLALHNVTFWGALADAEVIDRLKAAHVIVLPSITRSEAFGIVLLEGMAAGCVPIASHLPGVAQVVGNEGYTFPPGDVVALRDALQRLRDNPELRLHLAQVAQSKARLYSWERVVFHHDHLFRRLVGESGVADRDTANETAFDLSTVA